MHRPLSSLLLLVGPLSLAAVGQSLVYERSGDNPGDNLGWTVASIEDLDGDGVRDLLVGAPRTDFGGSTAGSVYALSGSDGSELYRVDGSSIGELFGHAIAPLPDLDGDGIADWVAGAPFASPGAPKVGRADVHSGADGSLLFHINGIEQFSLFGSAVAGAGDANGDTVPDLVVSAPYEDSNGTDAGTVHVCSGVNGAFLRSHPGGAALDLFGQQLVDMGDVTGDGQSDYAAATDRGAGLLGQLRAFDVTTGAVLYTKNGSTTTDDFGWAATRLGDLDGDQRPELAVGAPRSSATGFEAGAVYIYSGATGALLQTLTGGPSDELGWSLGEAGDWDGDGTGDVLAAARGPSPTGELRIYSGADSSLLGQIEAGPDHEDYGGGLAGGIDIDGDGRSEIAIGDGLADGGGSAAGSLQVFSIDSLTGFDFCLGDGSAGLCPCGNYSATATGCVNSTGSGARIDVVGTASVAADDLLVDLSNGIPGQAALLFCGSLQQNGGLGTILGDGLLCAGGMIQRFDVRIPDGAGSAQWGPGLATTAAWPAGATRTLQVWHRDTVGGPCSSGYNLSQGIELTTLP